MRNPREMTLSEAFAYLQFHGQSIHTVEKVVQQIEAQQRIDAEHKVEQEKLSIQRCRVIERKKKISEWDDLNAGGVILE